MGRLASNMTLWYFCTEVADTVSGTSESHGVAFEALAQDTRGGAGRD